MNIRKRKGILDIEGNGLYHTVTAIHCIVFRDIDTDEVFTWRPHQVWDFPIWAEENVEVFIGHNLIGYDVPTIFRILGYLIPLNKIIDTLVLSRLLRPVSPSIPIKTDNRIGGHSLGAWGVRLGIHKLDYNDWSKYTEEMLIYCIKDTAVNKAVYLELLKESEGFSETSIRLEHKVAQLLFQQEENGFKLDIGIAKKLQETTNNLIQEYLSILDKAFPPEYKLVGTHSPKTLKGTDTLSKVSQRIYNNYTTNPNLKLEVNGFDWDLYELVPFNPGSNNQIAERLLAKGWKPNKFTPKGNPSTDKDTLKDAIETLTHIPEVRLLSEYGIITDRNQKVNKWLELSQVRGDGKVHGKINPIGAGTHRCSHYDDNMANVASVVKSSIPLVNFNSKYGSGTFETFDDLDEDYVYLKQKKDKVEVAVKGLQGGFGWESRSCWIADNKDHCVIGADASGIQLRALAHYMQDAEYTKNLVEGDIHVVNQEAAGIDTRDTAKTFIYAWLLGAGDPKIGTIVGVKPEEVEPLLLWGSDRKKEWGQPLVEYYINRIRKDGLKATKQLVATHIKGFKVKEQFLDRTPALKTLKQEVIPQAAKQGFMIGLDGRKLWIPSEHLAMSLYLQGFEAVIMKLAMCIYSDDLKNKKIDFKQAAFVHDEWCTIAKWKDAETVGQVMVDSIKRAGVLLKSNCPLDGEYRIGKSWANVH